MHLSPLPKRSVHGIVLLDKPKGMSSNKALKKVQHLFRARKAGHTGSLDPLATGLLPICLGEATKLSQYLLEADKKYRVIATLGQTTTTYDAEGEVIEQKPIPALTKIALAELLKKFEGEINQIPPIYSALKVNGKALYHYARSGQSVDIKSRSVHIYEIKLLVLNEDSFELEVHCSKGTYIRSLIHDIGQALSCGAYVSELRRIACAGYEESQMISLDQLENEFDSDAVDDLDRYLVDMKSVLVGWPELSLSVEQQQAFQKGQIISCAKLATGWIKVLNQQGQLLGLAETNAEGRLAPRKVFQLLEALGSER